MPDLSRQCLAPTRLVAGMTGLLCTRDTILRPERRSRFRTVVNFAQTAANADATLDQILNASSDLNGPRTFPWDVLLIRGLDDGRLDLAPRFCAMVEHRPLSPRRLLGLANDLLRRKLVLEARRMTERAATLSVDSPSLLANCARTLLYCGDVSGAWKTFAIIPDYALTDTQEALECVTTSILHLLDGEKFEEATLLFERIDVGNRLKAEMSTANRMRLTFLAHALAKSPHHETIIPFTHNLAHPVVLHALAPYSHRLSRKAEFTLEHSVDSNAAAWIGEALAAEASRIPPKANNIIQYAKWRLLNDNPADAIALMDAFYRDNPTYSGGHISISFVLWEKDFLSEMRLSMSHERYAIMSQPAALLRASALYALVGDMEQSLRWLNTLYRSDANYFMTASMPAKWMFLAILLGAMGQGDMASRARLLALKHIPYQRLRERVWPRFPLGKETLPFPPFALPPEFVDE